MVLMPPSGVIPIIGLNNTISNNNNKSNNYDHNMENWISPTRATWSYIGQYHGYDGTLMT